MASFLGLLRFFVSRSYSLDARPRRHPTQGARVMSEPLNSLLEWDNISDVIAVLERAKNFDWSWALNNRCKYLDLRVDMRDGGCIIKDRDGKRITVAELNYQYSSKEQ